MDSVLVNNKDKIEANAAELVIDWPITWNLVSPSLDWIVCFSASLAASRRFRSAISLVTLIINDEQQLPSFHTSLSSVSRAFRSSNVCNVRHDNAR